MENERIDIVKSYVNRLRNIAIMSDLRMKNQEISKPEKFAYTCAELINLQKKKNADYGNSFDRNIEEFGLLAALIPISNKFHRLSQLIKSQNAQVKTESIEDTLRDLACYAIMTINNLKK